MRKSGSGRFSENNYKPTIIKILLFISNRNRLLISLVKEVHWMDIELSFHSKKSLTAQSWKAQG